MRELLYINKIITNFYLETLDPNNYQHITIYYLQKMCVCVCGGLGGSGFETSLSYIKINKKDVGAVKI